MSLDTPSRLKTPAYLKQAATCWGETVAQLMRALNASGTLNFGNVVLTTAYHLMMALASIPPELL